MSIAHEVLVALDRSGLGSSGRFQQIFRAPRWYTRSRGTASLPLLIIIGIAIKNTVLAYMYRTAVPKSVEVIFQIWTRLTFLGTDGKVWGSSQGDVMLPWTWVQRIGDQTGFTRDLRTYSVLMRPCHHRILKSSI